MTIELQKIRTLGVIIGLRIMNLYSWIYYMHWCLCPLVLRVYDLLSTLSKTLM